MFRIGEKVVLRGPNSPEEEKNFLCSFVCDMYDWVGKEAIIVKEVYNDGKAYTVTLADKSLSIFTTWNWDSKYIDPVDSLPNVLSEEEFFGALLS